MLEAIRVAKISESEGAAKVKLSLASQIAFKRTLNTCDAFLTPPQCSSAYIRHRSAPCGVPLLSGVRYMQIAAWCVEWDVMDKHTSHADLQVLQCQVGDS